MASSVLSSDHLVFVFGRQKSIIKSVFEKPSPYWIALYPPSIPFTHYLAPSQLAPPFFAARPARQAHSSSFHYQELDASDMGQQAYYIAGYEKSVMMCDAIIVCSHYDVYVRRRLYCDVMQPV